MILYHGSFLEIPKPDISFSRENVDFGKVFYTTSFKEQAENWCNKFKRLNKNAVNIPLKQNLLHCGRFCFLLRIAGSFCFYKIWYFTKVNFFYNIEKN